MKIFNTRKAMIQKGDGEVEVHWGDVLRKLGLQDVVDPTTVVRNLHAMSLHVVARRPREKPIRTQEHQQLRVRICNKWRKLPTSYFTDKVRPPGVSMA